MRTLTLQAITYPELKPKSPIHHLTFSLIPDVAHTLAFLEVESGHGDGSGPVLLSIILARVWIWDFAHNRDMAGAFT